MRLARTEPGDGFHSIGETNRRRLLTITRAALTAYTRGQTPPSDTLPEGFGAAAGVFVSLHMEGQLRGCIGELDCAQPLDSTVARCAIAAGSVDPRFPPVTAGELSQVSIEISILGPLEVIAGSDGLEVGRHGVMIELGTKRGLLLPQVAVEWKWDVRTFLAQTCRKADLPADAWQTGASLWRFEALVFGE